MESLMMREEIGVKFSIEFMSRYETYGSNQILFDHFYTRGMTN